MGNRRRKRETKVEREPLPQQIHPIVSPDQAVSARFAPNRVRSIILKSKDLKPKLTTIASWFAKAIAAVSFLATAVSLYPRMIIQAGTPLDDARIFSTPFEVIYDAPVPVHKVTFSCILEDVQSTQKIWIQGMRTKLASDQSTWLFWGDSNTFFCQLPIEDLDPFGPTITSAVVSIAIDYQYFFIPVRRWKVTRFQTARQADGKLRWIKKAPIWGWGSPPVEKLINFEYTAPRRSQ